MVSGRPPPVSSLAAAPRAPALALASAAAESSLWAAPGPVAAAPQLPASFATAPGGGTDGTTILYSSLDNQVRELRQEIRDLRGDLNGLRDAFLAELKLLRSHADGEFKGLRGHADAELKDLRTHANSELKILRSHVDGEVKDLREGRTAGKRWLIGIFVLVGLALLKIAWDMVTRPG